MSIPWWDKVRDLLGTGMVSQLERSAGWGQNTLRNALNKQSMPGALLGVKLSRALNVPAEWLFDPSQTMDDLPTETTPSVSDATILRVVAKALKEAAERAEKDVADAVALSENVGEALEGASQLSQGERPSPHGSAS